MSDTHKTNVIHAVKRFDNANSRSVVPVVGDSMIPDLRDGDLALIDHTETSLVDSELYAVRFSDTVHIKRVQHLPHGKVRLLSKNKNYLPVEITYPFADGVEVVGRVVASVHEW